MRLVQTRGILCGNAFCVWHPDLGWDGRALTQSSPRKRKFREVDRWRAEVGGLGRGMLVAEGMLKVLVMDTCGAVGGVALGLGDRVVAQEELPARGASAGLLAVVARLLEGQGWSLGELDGIGVVSGPGSFTGVRVGLAAAKGLCEAVGLPLVGVSRLEVLAEAGGLSGTSDGGFAVLDAGRGEFFVRTVSGDGVREVLWGMEELRERVGGGRVVIAEEKLVEVLADLRPEVVLLRAGLALPAVLRGLEAGPVDAALIDANYVRGEREIYGKARVGSRGDGV
jgi:tRNA threonylcarbamoyladenosine biosynthesis protein TsaB